MAIKEVCDRCDKEIDERTKVEYNPILYKGNSVFSKMITCGNQYPPDIMQYLKLREQADRYSQRRSLFKRTARGENALCQTCAKQVDRTLNYLFKSKPEEWEKVLDEVGKPFAVKEMLLEGNKV